MKKCLFILSLFFAFNVADAHTLLSQVIYPSYYMNFSDDGGFDIQKDKFTISPNPAKNKLNITLAQTGKDITLEVFDVLGKRVHKGILTQLESSVDVSNWKNGVYLVRITSNKITQTKRFIKQ